MKSLRNLVLLNAVLLLILGFAMAFLQPFSFPAVHQKYQEMATIRFLGMTVGGMGIVLWMLGGLVLAEERRRIALGLSIANALVAFMAMLQQINIWVHPVGWFLILLPLALTAALAWTALQPGSLETAAESLPIPDEIRRSWLRQIREAAVQEERNRLARDLHDSIKQQLFTINVSTAAAQELWEQNPVRAKAALVDVRRSAREAMVEMQALLHQLQPQALAAAGLVEALREQCEALGYRTGAEVSLELGEPIPDERLPPGAQETLFRIAQEALANVARHARAGKVRVWLGREGDSALLRVEDDGQGFDPAVATSGMGLRNLRERAESLQGMLEVASAPGAGTRIAVGVPLSPPPPRERSPVEKALQEEARPHFLLLVAIAIFWLRSAVPFRLALWDMVRPLLFILPLLGLAAASAWRTRSTLESSPDAPSEAVFRLRYLSYRNRAFYLAVTTWWALWYWRNGQEGWDAWSLVLLLVALGCAGLTIFELDQLYRVSELRQWVWPAGWEKSGCAVAFAVLGGCLLALPLVALSTMLISQLELVEALALLSGAAVLGYILTRQPRTQGATA